MTGGPNDGIASPVNKPKGDTAALSVDTAVSTGPVAYGNRRIPYSDGRDVESTSTSAYGRALDFGLSACRV
jgi:hypothetical protein